MPCLHRPASDAAARRTADQITLDVEGVVGRAAEGLLPGVDVEQSEKLEPRITPTDIGAQPHLPVGLDNARKVTGVEGQSETMARGYLKNAENHGPEYSNVKGALLYLAAGETPPFEAVIQGHEIRVVTINLNQPGPHIRANLLRLHIAD